MSWFSDIIGDVGGFIGDAAQAVVKSPAQIAAEARAATTSVLSTASKAGNLTIKGVSNVATTRNVKKVTGTALLAIPTLGAKTLSPAVGFVDAGKAKQLDSIGNIGQRSMEGENISLGEYKNAFQTGSQLAAQGAAMYASGGLSSFGLGAEGFALPDDFASLNSLMGNLKGDNQAENLAGFTMQQEVIPNTPGAASSSSKIYIYLGLGIAGLLIYWRMKR